MTKCTTVFAILLPYVSVVVACGGSGVPGHSTVLLAEPVDPRVDETESAAPVDAPIVSFLDGVHASEAFAGERLEPYFALMQPMEIKVKTRGEVGRSGDSAREACREHYAAAVVSFNDGERKAIREAVGRLHPTLTRCFPLVSRTEWSFIKVDGLEGELPHTRDEHIILPARFLGITLGADDPTGTLDTFLLHEILHVVQRLYPERFHALYEQLGFVRSAAIRGPTQVLERQLLNPDGVDRSWVYPLSDGTWIWPTMLLKGDRGGLSRNMEMLAIDVEPDNDGFVVTLDSAGEPVQRGLLSPGEYRNRFDFSAATYNPGEIVADAFSRLAAAEVERGAHLPTDELSGELATIWGWLHDSLR